MILCKFKHLFFLFCIFAKKSGRDALIFLTKHIIYHSKFKQMKNFYLFFLITFFSISLGAQEKSNNVAYEDTNVRFTVISGVSRNLVGIGI